jgi:hypothetical protein
MLRRYGKLKVTKTESSACAIGGVIALQAANVSFIFEAMWQNYKFEALLKT